MTPTTINHTGAEIRLRLDDGRVITIPRGDTVPVRVDHQRTDERVPIVVDGVVLGDAEVRAPRWRGARLPDPEPGVVRIVTTHVAELAALSGRSTDDLFVTLQHLPGETGRAYRALCPARLASPVLARQHEEAAARCRAGEATDADRRLLARRDGDLMLGPPERCPCERHAGRWTVFRWVWDASGGPEHGDTRVRNGCPACANEAENTAIDV